MSATISRADVGRLKAAVSLPTLIGQSVPLRRMGNVWCGPCPFHAEKTPSFGVYDDHYHCFGCGAHGDHITWLTTARRLSFHDAIRHLGGTLGRDPDHPRSMGPPPDKAPPLDTVRIARRIWEAGRDPAGTLAETYLASRRLRLPEDCSSLRFLDQCQRGRRDLEGGPYYAPALLAELTDPVTNEFCGVHRTFLLPDGSGKAPPITVGDVVLPSKAVVGNWGVIRLCDDTMVGHALSIGEGLENSLTVQQYAHWTTIWAAGCAHNIRNFPLLFGIEALSIFVDGDLAGRTAAAACAKRWAGDGREVILHSPPPRHDWNSILIAKGGPV